MDRRKVATALAISTIVFLAAMLLAFLNPLQVIQWKITDAFFKSRGPNDLITIIAIDDKSLSPEANLGRFKDWPRTYYSQLLRALAPYKPAAVAFDLDFREASRGMSDLRIKQLLRDYERKNATPSGMGETVGFKWYDILKRFESPDAKAGESGQVSLRAAPGLTHPDDKDFQAAIDESPFPVVLTSSLIFKEAPREISSVLPQAAGMIGPIFQGKNIIVGFKNIFADRDSVLRRFIPAISVNSVVEKNFALAAVEAYKQAGGNEQGAAGYKQTQLPIRYAAKPFAYRTLSFVDVLLGRYDAAAVTGKIVFVGATSRILQDMQTTPTSRNPMPGVEVNANISQQFLENRFSREQGMFGIIAVFLLLVFCGSAFMMSFPLRVFAGIFIGVLLGFPLFAAGMYQGGVIMNVIYPESAWILAGLAVLWYRNKTEIRAKKEIKKAFAHYVSPVVVEELARNPEMLKLGGKRQKISVLFSDIVGFTTLSEKMSPEDTVAVLNDYLTAMTEVVFAHHGTLDKYQGDAIMALYGAPMEDEHHAVNACHTGLEMRKALIGLHERWNMLLKTPLKDDLIKLDFRVGISTGHAVIGNVGSEKRFDYTAIGDIVNLGSRLESLNKKYGTRIIVDKETFVAVTENHNPFIFRKLDTVRVKGKEKITEVFEVVAFAENATAELKAMLDDFENGRIIYEQRNFAEAKQYFESALQKMPSDNPSGIYINRCNYFLRKPPRRDWDAVVDLEEK